MFGIYFSGTGNTKCYIEKLMKALDKRLGALLIEGSAAIDNFELYTKEYL